MKKITDYPSSLLTNNKIKLLEPFNGAKNHHKMQCLVCNHVWCATPISKTQTFKNRNVSGCPFCSTKSRQQRSLAKHEQALDFLRDHSIELLSSNPGTLFQTTRKLKFKNKKCGHEFEAAPGNILFRGIQCSVCGKKQRTDNINQWSKHNSSQWQQTADKWQLYKAKVTAITEQQYKQYKHIVNRDNKPRTKAGIDGGYHLDHTVSKRYCFQHNIPPHVCGDYTNLQMVPWQTNIECGDYIKGSIPLNMIQYVEYGERIQQYANVLHQQFGGSVFEQIDQTVVTWCDRNKRAAVIVIPLCQQFANQKIKYIPRLSQHVDRVFVVFEDEIATKQQLVVEKIRYYLNDNDSEKIHARSCSIKSISPHLKNEFLNQYHIQGSDSSVIKYGAYFDGQLVAVMTFSRLRIALGNKKGDSTTWELSRFATCQHYRIRGIASKLLKHFIHHHPCKTIISYADKRWSNDHNNMYLTLGFEQTQDNPSEYHYVIDGKRKHRWAYRKDAIKDILPRYDEKLTEYQNMVNHGYWRVWGCGTLRYQLRVDEQ